VPEESKKKLQIRTNTLGAGNGGYTRGRKRYTARNKMSIVACKEDTLWAQWVQLVHLKS